MEEQHMTQQVFADFIGLAPATLSSIFNGRTRPTMNVVEALKKKIPDISTDWLIFGSGEMFVTPQGVVPSSPTPVSESLFPDSPMLDFDQNPDPTPQNGPLVTSNSNSVRSTRLDLVREEVKSLDKPQRRVVEIRVYYDDQTWESFAPSKK